MQTRIEFIKISEENTVQLRNWECDDKEGPWWSNTKSMKTQHDTHKIVQTRIEFIKIWEENTVQGAIMVKYKKLENMARYSIQKAWKPSKIQKQYTKSLNDTKRMKT